MKRALLLNALVVVMSCAFAVAQGGNAQLEKVLDEMDKAAAGFRTAQADFVWDQYTKVVNDHDNQKGTIYFRRESRGVQMAADISEPAKKYVVYTGNTVRVYQPGIGQVNKYDVGKNKADVESFMVLGFGGRGHDLLRSFEVRYGGVERVGTVQTQKLELIPRSASLRNNFHFIVLWIDPATGMSVQQQFFSRNGDYRLARYSNIKRNEKIAENVFKLPKS